MTGAPPIGGAALSRIATIEARLGVGHRRGVDTRSTASFDDVLAAATTPAVTSTTSAQPVQRVPSRVAVGTSVDGVPYADLFQRAGARHGVDPALLAAVAKAESGFDPTAVSHAGAQGLMQLMPGTAAGLGVTNSFDPEQAVDGAARLLAGHLDTYGSVELALAAYNAGPGAVNRYGGIPPYDETQRYVPKVLAFYEELRR